MKDIYIIGSMNMDMTVHAARMPLMGESLIGSGFATIHGGKGANQAVAVARLGGKIHMCACVGKDAFGSELTVALKQEGIDTTFVRQENSSTGVAVITVVGGNNCIIVDPGANQKVHTAQALDFLSPAQSGDILLVQLETDFEAVKSALFLARKKGMVTVVNPAPAHKRANELCILSDYFIPNETEAEIITKTANMEKSLTLLRKNGVGTPIITLGERGCMAEIDEKICYFPCQKVEPVDTTGAGDTFCGAFCVALAEDKTIQQALSFALKAATASVQKAGAQPSIPYRNEIE